MSELRETARAAGACRAVRNIGQGTANRVGKQLREQLSPPIVGSIWNNSSRGLEYSSWSKGAYRPLVPGLPAGACDGIYRQSPRHLSVLWSCLAGHGHRRFSRETAKRVSHEGRLRAIQAAFARKNGVEEAQCCHSLQKYQAQFEVSLDGCARKQNPARNSLCAMSCEYRLHIETAWTECHGLFGNFKV